MNVKINWRWRFVRFLRTKIAKTPDAEIAPKWILIIYHFLFPINWLYERQSHIKYDPLTDKFHLMGMELSRFDIFKLKKNDSICS